ncbi:MAG: CBS domain-containing protein [Bacteroidota bacterium]|nr:CBS domain-containing protein [Bacteroidota bacterium]
MKAKDILQSKGGTIVSVVEDATIFEAATVLTKQKIGFLIVKNISGNVVGVLSERDVVQKCVCLKKESEKTSVRDIMTPKEKILAASEDDDIQSLMNTMTEKKIRHLPIFKGDQLCGIISIGDVIKNMLDAKDHEIKTLSAYVSGNYPG